jgi:hypothetical protein
MSSRALGKRRAEVDAVEHLVRLLADDLHQVDLAAGSPAAVLVVHRQHPQRRPQALAPGHLGAELDTAVAWWKRAVPSRFFVFRRADV